MAATHAMPPVPDRPPDFDDDFSTGVSPRRWIPHYLPHWTVPERSAARYRVTTDGLQLRIEADQLEWRPEDSPLRVSNLQTSNYGGPLGSERGTHRHRLDGLAVRTEAPTQLLFAPSSGRIDLTVSASGDPGCMTAAWLVGTEHLNAVDSGEICIFEIDAEAASSTTSTRVRMGIKAHHDPRLRTDMAELSVPVNARQPHTWTVVWGDGLTTIGCEGTVLRTLAQAPDYPLVLMVDLFELVPTADGYPKTAIVRAARGWDESSRTSSGRGEDRREA